MSAPASEEVLRARGLSKGFPGVRALADFDLGIVKGEVHALVGQNGAGKSTLIKILAGAHRPDAGTIEMGGEPVSIDSAKTSADLGIAVIHQDLNLISNMSVAENMHLGFGGHSTLRIFVNWRALRRETAEILSQLNLNIDPATLVRDLSAAEQQMIAIGRALLFDARIVIMDEPTAALGAQEAERVFELVRMLRDQGRSIIYVSHRLEEVLSLSDRITVMRDGRLVGTYDIEEVPSQSVLVEMIIGRSVRDLVRAEDMVPGEVIMKARRLTAGRVRDVDIDLRRGEVVGLAGLVGSGRTELARLLFGADRVESGTLEINGTAVRFNGPRAGIAAGIALLPEDRRGQAAVMSMTLRENLSLAAIGRFASVGFISRSRERAAYTDAAKILSIKAPSGESKISQLSGGNQQKVVIGKWLQTEAEVLIFDEPTQGIDVGTQEEIHALMRSLAAEGRAVIIISSDLSETVRVSDRVLVMRDGALVAELSHADADMHTVLQHCFGTDEIPADVDAAMEIGAS